MGASPAVALIAVALAASLARAELPAWLGNQQLTGSWNGWRERLAERGVEVWGGFQTEIFGNPVGGEHQSAQAVTSTYADLWLDLGRLAALKGLRFHLSAAWRAGRSLSNEDIGNKFQVQEAYGNETLSLVSLAFEQSLFDDRLRVAAGRLTPGDDFATSDLYCYLVQSAFCDNPLGLLFDSPSFATYPVSTWGVRAKAAPRPWGYVTAGVYQASRVLAETSNHGTDFAVHDGDGVLGVGEIGWLTASALDGRPGRVAIGGWYDSSRFSLLEHPAETQHGNGGVWLLAEQQVFREAPGSDQGLQPFVVVHGAADDVNPMPIFLGFGLVYRGLFPARDADTTVFGLAWGAFSDDLARRQRRGQRSGRRVRGPQDDELVLELGHRFALAPWLPWLTVQPDVQYVVDPAGTGDIPDALALGVQLAVTF